MRLTLLLPFLIALCAACSKPAINTVFAPVGFSQENAPQAPDYADESAWAALPTKTDGADKTPEGYQEAQDTAQVDVFFIHPTTFLHKDSAWNAAYNDVATSKSVDETVLPNQASVFNGVGKIYAPRYRQAHLKSYFNLKTGGVEALMLAYSDVKRAFLYYLENYNEGRPIILASHSQGSTHAQWLMHEFFDNGELKDQLVVAYVVGMPVEPDTFSTLKPCEEPGATGCYLTWNTYGKNHLPEDHWFYEKAVVTNPLTWTTSGDWSEHDTHEGILYYNYKMKFDGTISAKPHLGILWIKRPRIWYSIFLKNGRWHFADYNLFWSNIRSNVNLQVKNYLEEKRRNGSSPP